MCRMNKEIPKAVRQYMSAMGSKKTDAKSAAARRNGVATRFAPKPLEEFECKCGKCPDDPKTYCPRGRAILRRRAAAPMNNDRTPNSAAQLYAQSFARHGELTAFSNAQEDLHEYSADELALMESGAFAGPLQ